MITVVRNYFAFLLAVALCCVLATSLSAQDLQPKKTGLPGRTVWALATSGTSSVTTFAATDKGLWRSGDNGTSWTETSLKNIAVYAVKSRDIGRTSTLLVGTDRGVLRSTDGGNSWTSPEVTTGTVSTSNIVALKKVFDIEVVGNAWFVATEKGVYRSNNDGRSWSLVNIDRTADNNEVRGITVNGNTIIVNLWKEGLWRSTNNGNSWTKLTIGNESTPNKSVFAHTGTLWIQQGKQTTTATASMLFAGAVSGNIWRSTDNGSTWTKTFSAGTALRTASASATGVDAMTAIGNRLVSGAPNGLAFSNDNGRTWQTVRTTLPQPTTLAVDKQTLFVGLQSAPSAMTTAEKGASELTEAQPGIATYSVYNVGQTSCATPAVTGFSPPSTVTGSGALTITVNGQNFTPTTILRVERINAATNTLIDVFGIASGQSYDGASCTYISPTALSFTVPSSWRTVGSRIGFTPYTDADCGTVAGSGYTFLVNVPLSITSISPNSILRRSSTTPITITGTSFISGVTRVYGSMNGQPRVQLTPSSISSSSIGIDIDGLTFIGNGIITITVEDNNGGSASSTIAVPNAPPVISSVSPTSIFTGTVESYVSGFIGTYVSISGTALYVPSGLGIFGGIQGNYILGGANDQTTFYGSLNGQPRISLQRDVSSYNGSTGVSTVQLQIPPSLVSAGGTLVITAENVEIAQTGTISVSIINPLPTINSISPTSAVRGGGSVAATVTGTNFVPGSQVILTSANGRIPARTTYVSPTQLNTFWEAAALLPSIAVDSYAVTVENPTPGGGPSPQSQPLSIVNPVPIAAGLIPAQVIAGVAQPLTITGNGFMAGSQVYFNGQLKSSTFNNGSLSLALDVSDIPTAGDYPIYVTNLGPGGGSSGVLTLYALNYTPSITAFTPTVLSSGQDATLTLSGGGSFASGAVAILYPSGTELTTTFVNTNTLTVSVPGSLLTTVSETNYSIRVRNPAPGGGLSAPVTVPVRNSAPSLSGVSPNTLVAAAQDTPLTLTGGNFLSGATALISGPGIGLNTPLTTTVVNANTITATLPAGIAASVGQYSLIVRNPNSVADSPAQTINIVYPQAQLSSVTPSPIPAQNAAQTLTLTGANFVSGAQVRIQDEATNGQTVNQLLSASVINATHINATLPQTLAERVGRYRLTVDNPAPNAGVSGTVNVDVLALTPTFAALSTTSATMTGAAQTLTLTGTNFVNSAQNGSPQLGTIVEVNGQAVTASVLSATQISLTLPVTLLDSARVLTIRIVNPALTINGTPQGGGASTTRTFTLLNPAPALSGVAPQVVTANPVSPTPVALTLTGTNVTASSRVLVQRTAASGTTTVDTLQATPNNLVGGLATSLALTLPAPLFTDATTFTLRVLTPYGSLPAGFVSGGTSAPQTLTVQNPLPAITNLAPAQSLILQTTTVTITGTNFVQPSAVNNNRGTVAYFGATALPTSVLSPTSVQVTIASALLTVAQNYSITVRNPLVNGLGGGTSNAPTFTALNPTALLDSIVVPNGGLPLVVSSATRTVSVFGQFFVNGVSITLSRIGGNAVAPQTLSTTFVSSTQVTVVIPTTFLAEAGTLSFQAANPNPTGGASNTLSVAIVNPRPRLFTIMPTTATISASDLALTLDGGNFLPNSTIVVRGTTQGGADTTITLAPTGYTPANATPTRLTVSVPTSFAALAGTYFVWVQNPTPSVNGNTNSDTLSFFMRNPLPTLTSVTPATVSTGSGDTTVTLVGTNFTPLSSVLLNGATLAANRFVIQDRTTILATIPAALMAQATTLNVQVTIPAPGGGTSVVRTLTVRNAAPVLDSIAPATIAAMRDTVITAYGSGFNLTSQFRLIRGTTTVTLAIVSLPSSGVARLAISSSAIVTLATYQVRVFNSAPGGGTSVARNLVVQGGPAVSMEFLNVTTGIVAGASLNATQPGVQVRFRDALGILSDVTADSLYATRLPDAALQDTVRKGLRLTRLSAGLYSVPSTVFTTAGTFTLALETQQMAALTTLIGNRSFAVRPTVRANVWIEFFNAADSAITSLTATTFLAKTRLTYRDRFQNLTDSTVGIVRLLTVAGNPWGASTATLDMQRTSLGLYTLAAPLQITTAGTYYLNPAGLSRAVVLTTAMDSLVVAPAAPTAYIRNLRSLVNAGTSQPAFTIIVRDAGSNRVDLVAPHLTYTQLDTLPTGEHVTGEWTLTRTALGTYTAPAELFTVGGLYSFQMTDGLTPVPVSASGLTPDTMFTVLSSVATRLAIADADTAVSPLLPDTLRAGGVMPRLRFAFRDASGNLTDNGVTLTSATYRVAVGASSGTLRLERESVGLYWTSSTFASTFVTAGTYTITVRGIQADSIMTNGIQPGRRTFVVAPLPASSVLFTGLLPTLTSGAAQARFRATLRDTFNNLTDNVQTDSVTVLPLTNVWYSMSTDATVTDSTRQASAGLFTMQRTSLGVFLADAHAPITEAGNYAIGVQGITSTTGTAAFTVRPNVDYRIVFENVPDTLTAGDSLSNVTVRYFDRNDNPTDNSLGRVLYSRAGGSSTASVVLTRLETGVYAVNSTQATLAGTYTLSVSGIANVNYQGNRVLVLRPAPAASVQFTSVTPVITAGGNQAAFRLQLRDRFGNTTNDAGAVAVDSVRYTNVTTGSLAVSSGTIVIAPTGVGLFTAAVTRFNTSGNYTLALNGALSNNGTLSSIGTMNFTVNPAAVRTVEFSDVPDTLWTAQPLPPVLVRFRDLYGNLTDDSRPVTFTKTGTPASTGTVALNPLGTGVYTTAGTVFWRAGNYTFSVSGIAVANSLGKRTFFVKPDTALPLLLTAVLPQSLSVGDSAVHNWTLTLTGDNFNTSSAVYGRNNGVAFPTTFVDETTLTVIVPPALRQLGAMMLEVRSTAPPDTSNMKPVFVLDASIDYQDSLNIISSIPPSLTADEQTALAVLDQNPIYVNIQPIRLAAQPSEMLMTGQLGIRLPVMNLDASIALNYPKQVGERSFVVEGNVVSDTLGKETLLAIYDRRFVSMNFSANGKQYSLQPLGSNGVHVLAELTSAPSGVSCGSEITADGRLQSAPPPPIASCGNQRKIRVLFLATPDALKNGFTDAPFGVIPVYNTEIQKQVARTNTALRQSLEWSDREVVEIEVANENIIPWNPLNGYTQSMPDLPAEQRTFEDEIKFFNYIADVYLDGGTTRNRTSSYTATNRRKIALNANYYIRNLRSSYKADVIVIIHDASIGDGGGYYIAGFASQAAGFVVQEGNKQDIAPSPDNAFVFLDTKRFNDGDNPYLLAHELGHILGGLHFADHTKPNANQYGARFGYTDLLSVAQPEQTRNAQTIMAVNGNPSVHLYSSPKLFLPGAYYAYQIESYDAKNLPAKYSQFANIDIKNLATHTQLPSGLVLLNPRPMGSNAEFDVTSTIDSYAPAIAAYQNSTLDIDINLDNVPKRQYHFTPFLNKGQSATITIRFSGCAADAHLAQVFLLSRNQVLHPYNEVFSGSESILNYQVTMPNDADYSGITGIAMLETYAGGDPNISTNYDSDTQYFNIACGDCQKTTLKALTSLQSVSIQKGKRKMLESAIVSQFVVYPIAPNPIAGSTAELRFILPETTDVHIMLYNALGQPVKEVLHEQKIRGEHVLPFNLQDLPNGAYTCRITAGNQTIRQTIMIMQ